MLRPPALPTPRFPPTGCSPSVGGCSCAARRWPRWSCRVRPGCWARPAPRRTARWRNYGIADRARRADPPRMASRGLVDKPLPMGWPRISGAVFYDEPARAIDWLCAAFGFEVRLKVEGEGGRIEHSEL